MTSHFAIKPHVYRRRDGFLVFERGESRHVFPTRIFCTSRAQAEAVRDALKRDDDEAVSAALRS